MDSDDLEELRDLKAQANTNGTQRDYERWMAAVEREMLKPRPPHNAPTDCQPGVNGFHCWRCGRLM